MSALICGSLAFDTISTFPGRFAQQILPEQLHILNVSFLVPTLRREFGGCAGNIAYSLHHLGGMPRIMAALGSDGAVPDLGRALKDSEADVRLAAVEALRSIGPEARAAIGPLVDLMKSDKVDAVREKAGWALVTINIKGQKTHVPALIKLLSDSNRAVALPAIYLLGQIGRDAQESRAVLRQIAQNEQGPHATAAREALRQVEAPK